MKQQRQFLAGFLSCIAVAVLMAAAPPSIIPLSHTITSGVGDPNVTAFRPQVTNDTNIRIQTTADGYPFQTWVWIPGATNWR